MIKYILAFAKQLSYCLQLGDVRIASLFNEFRFTAVASTHGITYRDPEGEGDFRRLINGVV